jgi:hypothetical protein
MHEPFAPTPVQTVIAFARVSAAVDACSSAIAGFALLAGARAFMFIALLGWREPVLGGAGLVLLALIGWLRWQCGCAASAAADAARRGGLPLARLGRVAGDAVVAVGGVQPRCTEARNVACYNRSSRCDACDVCDATRCSRMTVFGQGRTRP